MTRPPTRETETGPVGSRTPWLADARRDYPDARLRQPTKLETPLWSGAGRAPARIAPRDVTRKARDRPRSGGSPRHRVDRPGSYPKRSSGLSFETGFVRAAGHRLFYQSVGDGNRGVVLCLHGGPGATHELMRPFTALAQFGFRVVLYDQFGCGRSQRPPDYRGLTIEGLADEADAVRVALDLGRCHLLGFSFGGALALQTILRHPQGYRSLIVGSGYASREEMHDGVRRLVSKLPKRERETIVRCEGRGELSNPRYLRAVAEFNRRHLSDLEVVPIDLLLAGQHFNPDLATALHGPDLLTGRTSGAMATWDVRDQLGRIHVPTLITVGRRDSVTPGCAGRLHRGIRGSKLVVFHESGHDCVYKEQDRYLATVRDFLEQVAA